MRTILFRNQRPNVIGPYIMRTGDRIYLWNGKVGVNAQTLPFPFALKFLNNSKVCTQATNRECSPRIRGNSQLGDALAHRRKGTWFFAGEIGTDNSGNFSEPLLDRICQNFLLPPPPYEF